MGRWKIAGFEQIGGGWPDQSDFFGNFHRLVVREQGDTLFAVEADSDDAVSEFDKRHDGGFFAFKEPDRKLGDAARQPAA